MGQPGFYLAVLASSLVAMSACGCRMAPPGHPEMLAPIHERALQNFSAAHLVKPSDTAAASALLPPWILLEEPGATNRVPGTVHKPTLQTVDLAPATLYFQAGTTTVRGVAYPQAIFLWANGTTPKWQGIRMTLSTAGQAIIWEVLRDSSGRHNIFVAESLEQGAMKEHGMPMEGRRFSIEQPRKAAPDVEVVRVIEDGPVPMGPMVYLDERLDVTTVICRCMPAQADNLTGAGSYEVQPADGVLASWKQAHGRDLWPQAPLEKWLRLPRHF